MDTGISNCRHIPDGEISSSKAVDLHLRPAGSFQQTSTISAHSIRISARGRCITVLSAGPADRIRGPSFPILSKRRCSWGRTPVLRPTSTSACSCPDMADSVTRRAGPGGPAQTWRSAPQTRQHPDIGKTKRHYARVRAPGTLIQYWEAQAIRTALERGAPHRLPLPLLLLPPVHGPRSAGEARPGGCDSGRLVARKCVRRALAQAGSVGGHPHLSSLGEPEQ